MHDLDAPKHSDSGESESERGKAECGHDGADEPQHWQPTIIQSRPLSGLCALMLTWACMLAALGVLIASNNQPVTSWSVQPTVPLAILSAAGAASLRYAKGCAVPVSWWYNAMRGNTVQALEDQWQAGKGVVSALTSFRRAGWVSMATLLTTW